MFEHLQVNRPFLFVDSSFSLRLLAESLHIYFHALIFDSLYLVMKPYWNYKMHANFHYIDFDFKVAG